MLQPIRTLMLKTFRVAATHSPAWNVLKTLTHTTGFWATFLWLLPWGIQTIERRLGLAPIELPHQEEVAAALFIAMGLLGISSGVTMAILGAGTPLPLDSAQRLVIRGPYRYVRNPMAIAGLSQGAAVALGIGSPGTLLYVLSGYVVWNFFVRGVEEEELLERFGPAFAHYRDHVPCWIPRLTPYEAPDA